MRKLLLITSILFLTTIGKSFALTNLTKSQAEKFIQYFENYNKPVINWDSCDKTFGKVLYQAIGFKMQQIENSNLYNIYATDSPIPFDDHGYIGDAIIEISPIETERIYINTSNNYWVNICDVLEFSSNACVHNFTFNFPELKSKKSISFNDYEFIGSSKTEGELYVMMEKRDGNLNEFWIKQTIPKKKFKNKNGKYITSGGGYSLAFIKLDCEERVYDCLKYIVYDSNGKVTNSKDGRAYNEKVVPKTSLDVVREYVCE